MKNLKNNNEAAINLNIGILAIIILAILGLVVASLITLFWGLFGLIGLGLIICCAYILFKKKGNVKIAANSPFTWCLVLGIMLIIFSAAGLDVMPHAVDLHFLPWNQYSLNLF